jgi:antitoxin VapB
LRKRDVKTTAKLFMHGRSQAVRLPKEFRFEGSEVRVSRIGAKVVLEPMEKPPFDVKAWRAKLDSYSDVDFPAIERLPPLPPDDELAFD